MQEIKKGKKSGYVVGIDEVGRGPVAGPVTVCAVLIRLDFYKKFLRSRDLKNLRDSKKLSPKKRAEWFLKIKKWRADGALDFSLKSMSAKQIDKQGIAVCIKKCLRNCLIDLDVAVDTAIFLDGSLYAPVEFKNQKTIIKGDEKIPIISLASIVAKVSRDGFMMRLSKRVKNYGFEIHKGYGTAGHVRAIKRLGVSDYHRRTFLRGGIL